MSGEVMYRAIDLLFESAQEELRLDFTGGEPLLRFDLVAGAVKYAKRLAKAKNKKVSFYLVTNLIELNDGIADFLKDEEFFLELSLDGDERFHNLNKVGKDPRLNAYRSTVSRLRKVFSRNIRSCAVMVATPDTARNLAANFRHLLNLGFRYIGINYALCSYWGKDDRKVFLAQLDSIRRAYYPYIAKGIIELSNLGYREEPAILNTELMIDVDGSMHLLTDWLFEGQTKGRATSLGNVCDISRFDICRKSRFNILYRLLQFNPESSIQDIIFNNIEMGNHVKKRIESWKKR